MLKIGDKYTHLRDKIKWLPFMSYRMFHHRLPAARRTSAYSNGLGALKRLLALSIVFLNAALQANPVGPVVTQGQATFDAAGNRLTVTNTPGTVINWQTFNIPAGNTTHFQQQGANSSVLNRVVTNDPSKIFGTLSSNGRVILVNQSGIVVGAGAVVDTAGFIASTLNMSEADRLLNKGRFSGSGGSIQIDGVLRSSNGDIVLIAPQIHVGTQALVKADNGVVTLAAGQQVMLTGRGLEGITLELQAPTDKVVNLGRLEGDAVGIFASQLKHSGAIVARNAVLEGGRVVLQAIDDALLADGTVDASGTGTASTGGRVTMEGQTVTLANASIRASGTVQGGTVLVGGGWNGKDASVTHSQATTVDAASRIDVSGQGTGSAGTVVVWSDGHTRYAGQIDARGGPLGGDGGQVQVSGKAQLEFTGRVRVDAPNGKSGSVLRDRPAAVVPGTSDPAVTFSDPPSIVPGTSGVLSVTVSNLGAVTDTITVQIEGLGAAQTLVLTNLAPGEVAVIGVNYTVGPLRTGVLTPVVSVSGTRADADTTNNVATARINLTPRVNFGVSVADATLTAGATNTVAITVQNTGPSAGNGTATISLPGGATQIFVIASLAPNETVNTSAVFFLPDDKAVSLSASVATAQADTVPDNNAAIRRFTVPAITPTPVAVVPTPTLVTTPTPVVTTPTPTAAPPTTTVAVTTPTTPSPNLPAPTVTPPAPPSAPTLADTSSTNNNPPKQPPAPNNRVDIIVNLLGNPDTRGQVLAALRQQDDALSRFVRLLVQNASEQERSRDNTRRNDGDVVISSTGCRS